MVAERALRAFWPLWVVIALALAPLIAGWQDSLAIELVWSWLVAALLAALGALGWGLWRFRWPSRAEALERLDAAMPGRPIAALADSQAVGRGDAGSEGLWRAHLERMTQRTRAARAVPGNLRLNSRDPFGLRYIALLFVVTALLFGSVWRVGSVATMTPGGGAQLAQGPVWEGWIEPPAYTGLPSLYLADIPPGPLEVPQGSAVTLRLYGEVGALTVAETVSGRTEDIEPASAAAQDFAVTQAGTLSIDGPGGAEWEISVLADRAPEARLTGPIEVDGEGQMSQPFEAADDYGVTGGSARIVLDPARVDRSHGLATEPDPREPLTVDLPMPFTGDRTEIEGVLAEDFSQHPFANLPVTIQLTAEDAAGQSGTSEQREIVLPGRRFFQPLARAVIEQRRDLLWSRGNAGRVLDLLRAASYRPEEIFPNQTTYLRLRVSLRRLEALADAPGGLTAEGQEEIAQALWDLAVQLEDGTLGDARERLERAQERLAEAMRNGASPEEVQELMQELREATQDYLSMLARNAEPGEEMADRPQSGQGEGMEVTQDELQALMDRIQQLMEEGRMAEAQELMEQLNQMMENLQVTQGQGEGGPGEQSMEQLGDTLREQQDLSDQAFRDLQEQFGSPGQQGQGGKGPRGGQAGEQPGAETGEAPGDETGPGSLADQQQALRDELDRQRGQLPGLDGEAAEAMRGALDRAEEAMDGAEQALRQDDLAGAIDRQSEAMDALREGMRNLGQAMADARRDGQPGEDGAAGRETGRLEPAQRDPLGRELGEGGRSGTEQGMLEGEDADRRAQELLGEIRRRAAEQERPESERDYLRRLLDLF
ncbi:uncharacterized protein (TIGR02302 family) [Pseudoroseicyclus aestuarii]|uniref:Uncharacterized protein (TIGR02302 family) n=2 Tax=Pseudoroseicyclus aestuarii TaxID=1795041 RepID=A0A318SRV0_9RHOB|nr:uncharacterized protein (TIGR02302 family) [Pseudoroseicyclus aestuarii]